MIFKVKILAFLAVVGFVGWNGFKMYKRYHRPAPSPAVAKSVPAPSAPVAPVVEPPSMVRCDSWGTSSDDFWGYADGLIFFGSPDSWQAGSPCYARWRGESL